MTPRIPVRTFWFCEIPNVYKSAWQSTFAEMNAFLTHFPLYISSGRLFVMNANPRKK